MPRNNPSCAQDHESSQGFILLEVLIAMSLVLTSWLVLSHTYQALALRFGQLQEQRMQSKKESDQFEIHLHSAASAKTDLINESARMSSRSSAKPHARNAAHQK